MNNSGLVSIIIYNHNSKIYFDNCFNAIQSQTYPEIETVFVDCASTDGSADYIREHYPKTKIFTYPNNFGFAKANNEGIKLSSGKYILCLNLDTIMSENFIEEMVAVIKSAEKIGSVSGKVLLRWKCNKNLIDTTGHCVTNTGAARNRGKGEADQGQYDHKTNQRIFGVCAAASLYRREMLDDIAINNEFFDEDFDTGLEDVDLDWRANLRGWKSFYAPRAVVFHEQGGVISYQAKRARLLHAKNSLLILIKNETLINLLLDLPSFLFIAIPETIKNLSVDPFLFESYIQVFKLLPKTLKKRHFIMKNKKISSLTFRRLFENSPENISIFIFNLTTLIIVIVLFFCLGGLNLLFLFLSLIIISAIIRNLLLLFERIKHEHLNSI